MEFVTPEDAKSSGSVKIVYTINALINTINIVFDLLVVKATLKNKSLHKPCPILMGIYFLCQLLCSTSVFITYAIIILPSAILDSITMRTCAIINFVPVTAFYGFLSLLFVIGFDRLLSVYFPLWYSIRLPRKWHILFLSILSGSMPLYISICIVQSGIKYGNLPTLCTMAELLRDQLPFEGQFGMFTNCGIIILNLAICAKFIWRKFCKRTHAATSTGVSQMDLQVLKAVGLILGVQIIIWVFGTTFFTFYFNFFSLDIDTMDPIGFFQLVTICGIITSILSALEVPILYFTSTLHRAALKKELNALMKLFRKYNQVQIQTIIVKPASKTMN